jgi:hypothetical protein
MEGRECGDSEASYSLIAIAHRDRDAITTNQTGSLVLPLLFWPGYNLFSTQEIKSVF